MPGIFGGVGCDPKLYECLRGEFASSWESSESIEFPTGILGGHAFQASQALHRTLNGVHFVVDGEEMVYRVAREFALKGQPALFQEHDGEFALTAACKGNLVAMDPKEKQWHLAMDWTGGFPLYYSRLQKGLLFCSRLKPLARVLHASTDLIAIREYLHDNYLLASRSLFKGIYRLMPGQILNYSEISDELRLRETSKVWVGLEDGHTALRQNAAIYSWESLVGSLRNCLDPNKLHALMMSGGWDSRTLLAAAKRHLAPDKLMGYTHGDVLSRELRLTERICKSSGVKFHREPIDNALLDPDLLRQGFDRVETVAFPEWHRAGHVLASLGVKSVTAGVFGEVLGGHYGSTMLVSGARKIAVLAAQLFGWSDRFVTSMADACDFLRIKDIGCPWHVKETLWDGIDLKDAINGDIETTVARFTHRGITSGNQLIDAFITEHRGAQYINSQLLSCRTSLDVSIPFGDRDFLALASRIPFSMKVHNYLNREMLKQQDSDLLRFSTAATLVPTAWPIEIQEASRLMRYYAENTKWALHSATHGRIHSPHIGWWYWEFLGNGVVLNALVDSFECGFWNKSAMRERIKNLERPGLTSERHAPSGLLLQTLLKDYNVDLMLR